MVLGGLAIALELHVRRSSAVTSAPSRPKAPPKFCPPPLARHTRASGKVRQDIVAPNPLSRLLDTVIQERQGVFDVRASRAFQRWRLVWIMSSIIVFYQVIAEACPTMVMSRYNNKNILFKTRCCVCRNLDRARPRYYTLTPETTQNAPIPCVAFTDRRCRDQKAPLPGAAGALPPASSRIDPSWPSIPPRDASSRRQPHRSQQRAAVLAGAVDLDIVAAAPNDQGLIRLPLEGHPPTLVSLDDLSIHPAETATSAPWSAGFPPAWSSWVSGWAVSTPSSAAASPRARG